MNGALPCRSWKFRVWLHHAIRALSHERHEGRLATLVQSATGFGLHECIKWHSDIYLAVLLLFSSAPRKKERERTREKERGRERERERERESEKRKRERETGRESKREGERTHKQNTNAAKLPELL